MSNLTEVLQNMIIVVFKLSTSNNLGSLAELLRFQAFNLQMWRKYRRKACFSSFHLAKLCKTAGSLAQNACFSSLHCVN
jgi:hypothetical protein